MGGVWGFVTHPGLSIRFFHRGDGMYLVQTRSAMVGFLTVSEQAEFSLRWWSTRLRGAQTVSTIRS